MSLLITVELEVIITLPREGIVVSRYASTPWQGFALKETSTLEECPIASLTSVKAAYENGDRRRDLVSFCLREKKDADRFSPGQQITLREVEPSGFLRT